MEQKFYGVTTVSERGQIVIPQEARSELNLSPGEKLLVMKEANFPGLILIKADQITEMLSNITKNLAEMEKLLVKLQKEE
ncbi:MAG: AbrB/MazE/SpoVT family DNA-binding domain-containing protein [bacterium]